MSNPFLDSIDPRKLVAAARALLASRRADALAEKTRCEAEAAEKAAEAKEASASNALADAGVFGGQPPEPPAPRRWYQRPWLWWTLGVLLLLLLLGTMTWFCINHPSKGAPPPPPVAVAPQPGPAGCVQPPASAPPCPSEHRTSKKPKAPKPEVPAPVAKAKKPVAPVVAPTAGCSDCKPGTPTVQSEVKAKVCGVAIQKSVADKAIIGRLQLDEDTANPGKIRIASVLSFEGVATKVAVSQYPVSQKDANGKADCNVDQATIYQHWLEVVKKFDLPVDCVPVKG